MIDLNSYITNKNHFKWSEALYLHSIQEYHTPSDVEIQNIIAMCHKLDIVREYLNQPMSISCWIRPNKVNCTNPKYQGFDYNHSIGGAKGSQHIYGRAVDFVCKNVSVDQTMDLLKPKLSEFKLSAENNGSAVNRLWIHLQDLAMPDGTYRVFNP